MENIKEINVKLIRRSEGVNNRIVPMAQEFDVVNGNSLFNIIMKETRFSDFVEDKLNSKFNVDFEGYKEEYVEKLRKQDYDFKELIRASKPKITIKIELEKYE